MKIKNKHLGLVTKKFNDFFLVDLKNQENSGNSQKFLCFRRGKCWFERGSTWRSLCFYKG